MNTSNQTQSWTAPLLAEPTLLTTNFGVAIVKIMHQFDIPELPVIKDGIEVGRLILSHGTALGITLIGIGWQKMEEQRIRQIITDADRHDLPLQSGVFESWDLEGWKRLNDYQFEIIKSLLAAVAARRD